MQRIVRVDTRRTQGEECGRSYLHHNVTECKVTPGPERVLKIIETRAGEQVCTIYPMSAVEKAVDFQRDDMTEITGGKTQ